MGVLRCSVMEQNSTGPGMPACAVCSYTPMESYNTPKSWGSVSSLKQWGEEREMDAETDKRTHSWHVRSQEEGLCVLWCLRWTKSARLRGFLLPPPLSPTSLEDANPSQYSSLPASLITFSHPDSPSHNNKAFFSGFKTQPRHNYKVKGHNYDWTT